MADKILATFEAAITATWHGDSMATAAGSSTDNIDNTATRASMCHVYLKTKTSDHAPTANTPIKLYLIRRSSEAVDIADNSIAAGHSASGGIATEPTQAECLGSIIVTTGVDTVYEKSFVAYDMGPEYQFVIWNATGQHLSTTAADHVLQVIPVTPEGQ